MMPLGPVHLRWEYPWKSAAGCAVLCLASLLEPRSNRLPIRSAKGNLQTRELTDRQVRSRGQRMSSRALLVPLSSGASWHGICGLEMVVEAMAMAVGTTQQARVQSCKTYNRATAIDIDLAQSMLEIVSAVTTWASASNGPGAGSRK
jgi:hypothetical protein